MTFGRNIQKTLE